MSPFSSGYSYIYPASWPALKTTVYRTFRLSVTTGRGIQEITRASVLNRTSLTIISSTKSASTWPRSNSRSFFAMSISQPQCAAEVLLSPVLQFLPACSLTYVSDSSNWRVIPTAWILSLAWMSSVFVTTMNGRLGLGLFPWGSGMAIFGYTTRPWRIEGTIHPPKAEAGQVNTG